MGIYSNKMYCVVDAVSLETFLCFTCEGVVKKRSPFSVLHFHKYKSWWEGWKLCPKCGDALSGDS